MHRFKIKKVNIIFRNIFFILVLGAFACPTQAQVPELINDGAFKLDAKAAVDSIYNFRFEGAEEKLAEWQQKHPDHPYWSLFEGMRLWWKILSDLEDTSRDQAFFEVMKKADYQAGKLLHRQSGHIDGLLVRAIANGYMARQYANREDWLTSMRYGRRAIQAYSYLVESESELSDLKLAEGLKLYYLAHIPNEYPAVKTVSWALPDGNKQEGIKQLRAAAAEAVFARAEATYFLGNINYNYEKKFGIAVENFEKLHRQYPNNNYYARILLKSYYKQGRFEEALQFIDATISRWDAEDLPHGDVLKEELWTWKARILEQEGDTGQALKYFKKAFHRGEELPNTENRSFHVVSGYYAGKLLYEDEHFDQAQRYLAATTRADAKGGYRKRAEELLKQIR